ncbi:MAG: metallophosphoesterase family protein [Deltaproteobacteria bacterium]|nr:metallophosphoesterase family protein [Deltaproteobacteria bacterium]
MLIYAVADIHGKPDRFAAIRQHAEIHCPDVIVVAGDITNFTAPCPAIALLNDMPAPVLAVRGNTDLMRVEHLLKRCSNITPLHLSQTIQDTTPFMGLSGTVPVPFRSRIRFREKQLFKSAEALINEHTVLVAHPPPFGYLDEIFGRIHAGSRRLYDLVIKCQPMLVLCGHIHECAGMATIGKTRVVNCNMAGQNAGALIEVDSCRTPRVIFL